MRFRLHFLIQRHGSKPPSIDACKFGRVSGIALITGKVQRYRDRQRYGAYLAKRDALKQRHQQERTGLARRHEIQAADLRCRLRALDQIEQREYQTLETAALKARRQRINARHGHMPPMAPVLSLRAGTDGLAAERHLDFSLSRELARAAAEEKLDDKLRLAQAFGPVSGSDEGEQEGGGDSGGLRPDSDGQRRMRQRGRRRLAADFARMVDDPQGEGEGENEGGGTSTDDLKPAAETKLTRGRRRKERSARKPSDRKTERMRTFNEAARGEEDDGSEGSATEAPAPAAGTKIRRRKRRKVVLDHEFNSVSGAAEGHGGDDAGGGPRKRMRRHPRDRDPPRDDGPPRPRRRRKRDFDRGL